MTKMSVNKLKLVKTNHSIVYTYIKSVGRKTIKCINHHAIVCLCVYTNILYCSVLHYIGAAGIY